VIRCGKRTDSEQIDKSQIDVNPVNPMNIDHQPRVFLLTTGVPFLNILAISCTTEPWFDPEHL